MKNKLMQTFLILIAAAVVFGGTGCGSKSRSLPSLDTKNAKSVAVYYASCIAAGEYDKAAGVAQKDGIKIVETLKSQPDSKQSKEVIAAFEKIAQSFDSVMTGESKNGTKHSFSFENVDPVDKIGVRMEGGKFWVYDL